MILLNFDFIYSELMKNTMPYLLNGKKEALVKKGELWGFNGKGFKNQARLLEYMYEEGFLNEKEFIKKLTSPSRRTNHETVEKLHALFKKETPLFINTEKVHRLMLLSSNLMFKPNDKIFFTTILANPYKYWTAEQIVQSAIQNNPLPLSKGKIEQRLNCYVNGENPIIISRNIAGEMQYAINFTNFIYYIKKFDKKK